ncbi:DedA family protein [Streptomyces sp. NPDC091272]|uniref:DedA family protein n=1 Tax=Streptomyces sp. NPDC091272 TaxID=3365981 RepID=UPI0038154AFD
MSGRWTAAQWVLEAAQVVDVRVPPEATQQAVGYPTLFALVAFGALVPVVPTGALVSTAAVVALHHTMPAVALLIVFLLAAAGAFVGDLALYWLGVRGVRSEHGSKWLDALRRRAPQHRLEQAQQKLEDHRSQVLTLSRLVPAGRIPVMLACLLAKMPIGRFARGDVPACLAWAVAYQLIGVLGGSLFSEPWAGVAAAIAVTLLISGVPSLWRRLRRSATV